MEGDGRLDEDETESMAGRGGLTEVDERLN